MKKHATLNFVYRLIWSKANNCWVAVAEKTKAAGKSSSKRGFVAITFSALMLGIYAQSAFAGLEGGTIVGGQGEIINSNLVRQDSARLAINALGFGVKLGETFTLQQNAVTDIALFRILGQNPSDILGNINAKGQLFISNPNGILFGKNAQVNVGGLIATTLNIDVKDFMDAKFNAAKYSFYNIGKSGRVVNLGNLTATEGGYIALLAPEVRNEGVISGSMGTALLAAGDKVTLDLDNGSLLGYTIDKGTLNALVENKQLIQADGGKVFMGAKAADKLSTAVVNNTGIVRARSVRNKAGVVSLSGDYVVQAGTLDASGRSGGAIDIDARAIMDSGKAIANGSSGSGGDIHYHATEALVQTASASMQANGKNSGGNIRLQSDGSLFSSGSMRAGGKQGGVIDVLGESITLAAASVDASGTRRGGKVHIGGDFHGANLGMPNADTVFINGATKIKADGGKGQVAIWSDERTDYYGSISANRAGMIEVSSKGDLHYGGGANAGKGGSLLLDPANIIIEASAGPAAFELLDPHSAMGNNFGNNLVALGTTVNGVFTANGKVVVGVAGDDLAATNAGAAYLFDTATGALLSTLTGSNAGDQIGSDITMLTNGNYVLSSSTWANGRGAVTWGSSLAGVSGMVSASNSLVGDATGDQVGSGGVYALTNGNYVVSSDFWDSNSATNVGAVTWADGAIGISGLIDNTNSLVGTNANDRVGSRGVTALDNGNYVVQSPNWRNLGVANAGAATWGDGTVGINGEVTSANSLVGSTLNDNVGFNVLGLANGNYVVSSELWDNGGIANAGAATWGNGQTGIAGEVTSSNSLVGEKSNDQVGRSVTALANGNYVVNSAFWDNGAIADAGAATWGDGTTGVTGNISIANSLVGTAQSDWVGLGSVALTNGNYVVISNRWGNGLGAVTWGNGSIGVKGAVSSSNSLVGSKVAVVGDITTGDQIGLGGVYALSNGNYVVNSYRWDNGTIVNAGAVTWGNGTTGITGAVSAGNSLVGTTAGDFVGSGGVFALTNGNYVVNSYQWNGNRGAVTWGDGVAGIAGAVSSSNSLVGTAVGDFVGAGAGGVYALTNGNYVVSSYSWNGNRGAATWGDGATGITGAVSASNSLVGTAVGDQVSSSGVYALNNGNYVVNTYNWNSGRGAATWGNGATGITGAVSSSNSLVGATTGDYVGSGGTTALANGNYLVRSFNYAGARGQLLVSSFGDIGFNTAVGQTMTFNPSALTQTLAAGTAVTLQASNDITVNAAINVGGASGGVFTLQAGRNINLNSTINTANGDFTAVAGDPGAIPADRLPGTPTITLGLGASINTGSGKTILAAIDGNFINNSGSATPLTASQWHVYSADPASNSLNGMVANEQYDQPYVTGSTPAYAASGNWLLYSAAPPTVIPPTKPPGDVITVVQKPPPDKPVITKKPLAGGCGESLILTSASSAFERFNDVENDSCGLDLLLEEPAGNGKSNCPAGQPKQSTKEKTEKL